MAQPLTITSITVPTPTSLYNASNEYYTKDNNGLTLIVTFNDEPQDAVVFGDFTFNQTVTGSISGTGNTRTLTFNTTAFTTATMVRVASASKFGYTAPASPTIAHQAYNIKTQLSSTFDVTAISPVNSLTAPHVVSIANPVIRVDYTEQVLGNVTYSIVILPALTEVIGGTITGTTPSVTRQYAHTGNLNYETDYTVIVAPTTLTDL